MNEIHIGTVIKTIRDELGLSQEKVGDGIGIAREYICRIELGELPNPTLKTLIKIANVLKMKTSELLARYEKEIANANK